MKYLLLLLIKLYWAVVPKDRKRQCLFRVSCSRYVYQVTKDEGLYQGLLALRYRFLNCKSGFQIIQNPVKGRIMILPGGDWVADSDISEVFRDVEH